MKSKSDSKLDELWHDKEDQWIDARNEARRCFDLCLIADEPQRVAALKALNKSLALSIRLHSEFDEALAKSKAYILNSAQDELDAAIIEAQGVFNKSCLIARKKYYDASNNGED